MPGPPPKDLSSTSARHTHDQYQAKWDKWENDDFINAALSEVDEPPTASAKAAPKHETAARTWIPEGVVNVLIRILPAQIMCVAACFSPPKSPGAWCVFGLVAAVATYLNKPQADACHTCTKQQARRRRQGEAKVGIQAQGGSRARDSGSSAGTREPQDR